MKQKLDEYDQTFDRDSGESLMQVQDTMRCAATFSSVQEMRTAFQALIMKAGQEDGEAQSPPTCHSMHPSPLRPHDSKVVMAPPT